MEDIFVNVDAYLDEIAEHMPHFVFYRRGYCNPILIGYGDYCEDYRDSKLTDCYCTACHTRYEDGINKPSVYKHKEIGRCANCGATVEYRQMNRGRRTYYRTQNFAVFEGAGDRMRISCIRAIQKFPDEELEPELSWQTVTRYELQPHKAVQFKWRYIYDEKRCVWEPKKSKPIEPNFAAGFFWRDNTYTLINHDCIGKSFLRYLFKGWESELPSMYIQWLCRYAEHPQIEYFLHGGLGYVAKDYVHGKLGSTIRLNWRSNDLKKILRLSKPEIEYLIQENGVRYSGYVAFRKSFFQGKTPADTVKYFKAYGTCIDMIKEVEQLSGLERKKIMDFGFKKMNKEGGYFFMIQYRDYLRECKKLQYDMTSTAILMPKDVFAAHEKTQKLLTELEDKELNELLRKHYEKRQELEVVDMELGLMLMQPKAVHEIVDEGAKLNHCVGGYADRHAEGSTTIMFLRLLSRPDMPYYTMEVSNDLKIKQCYGYRNTRDINAACITAFESRYTEYLEFIKKQRKKAKEKEKRKKRQHKAAA